MTDYHYMAEEVFNDVRACGSTFWIELDQGKRDYFAAFVQSAERVLGSPDPNEWCPECDELTEKVEHQGFDLDDAYKRIDELEEELTRYRKAS